MLRTGDTLSVTIEKPAAGGRMIARVNGQVVLVSGAIPCERVVVRIERVGKGVAYAGTVQVEDASVDRRAGAADPLCGGCVFSHIAYERQLAIKSEVIADAFKRIGRLALPSPVGVAASPEDGYRMRARLHARDHRFGFFREGSHQVCDARQTRQLLPSTFDALDALAAAIQAAGLETVREVEVAENVEATDRVVALDTTSPIDGSLLDRLAAVDGLTGLATSSASRGTAHVSDHLHFANGRTVTLRRHVRAFFQGNRHLLSQLVQHVVDQVTPNHQVIDLYAGVGLFSLSVAAQHGVSVTAVEGDRYAAADLTVNAGADGAAPLVVPTHLSVEEFVEKMRPSADIAAGTVIVDPPRTGMSREAVDGLLRLKPARIVYVSCDVATLARDARRIVDEGYGLEGAHGFDLFPNTPHVETVVSFSRS